MFDRKLVEIFHDKRIMSALCTGQEKDTLFLLTEEDNEVKVKKEKILSIEDFPLSAGKDKASTLKSLAEISEKREEMKNTISLEELWDVCREEQDEYSLEELCGLYFGGDFSPDERSAMNRVLHTDKIYFSRGKTSFLPHTKEQVEHYFEHICKREEKRKKYECIGMNFKAILEGRSREFIPEARGFIVSLEDVCIKKKESPRYKDLMEIFKSAGITSKNAPFDILVRSGTWNENENILLREYTIQKEFPMELEQYCSNLITAPDCSKITAEYGDFTCLHTVTVDDETTKDFDDALSVQVLDDTVIVGIHITDISEFISRDSPLDEEARYRGTSIYLPDLKIEMIPKILSESKASLIEGERRITLSFFVRLDDEGNILSYEIKKGIICVHRRLTYDDADRLIEEEGIIRELYTVAQKLFKKRIENGALNSPIPRIQVRVRENNELLIRRDDPARASQILVSELMILANSVAGDFCLKNNIPAIYRGQPPPDEKIPHMGTFDPVILYNMRKFLKKGTTEVKPHRHHGLGSEHYVQVTSPLRRYSDLVMHRQIKNFIEFGESTYSEGELSNIIDITERSLEIAELLERERKHYWILKYLETQIGNTVRAVIIRLFHEKMLVQLWDTLWETDCQRPKGTDIVLGGLINVIVELVWPRESIVRVSYQSKCNTVLQPGTSR